MMADPARSARKKSPPRLNNDAGPWETIQRFWRKSYAGDYLGVILLVVAYVLIKLISEPWHRMFRLDDPRLLHPHAEVERVSVSWLFIYAGLCPLLILIAWTLAFRPDTHKAHVTILGFFSSILLTTFLTDIFKDGIGRPRPDLIARCKPDLSVPVQGVLVTVDICMETRHHLLHDGWRSFPSGHSSFAFAGFGWLSFFLASQTHLLRPRASLITVLICAAPLICAAMVAISRLEDYRHDVFDVIAGSLLGFSVALLNWRRFYPSLLSKTCDEPYVALVSGRSSPNGGFARMRDEEDGVGVYAMDEEE